MNKKRKGYSLMELITTMAIITVVLIITLLMFNNMMKTVNRTLAKIETIQELLKLDDVIQNEVIKMGPEPSYFKGVNQTSGDGYSGIMYIVEVPFGNPSRITKLLEYIKDSTHPKGVLILKEKPFESIDFDENPNDLSWQKEIVLLEPTTEATVLFGGSILSGTLGYTIEVSYRSATLRLESQVYLPNIK
ncbi:MAG: prepilin-type N-terminal cleavage/methylation domain-containing protein [Thermotogaceae bacterium]|nr:prepilin-type N-terminal cleavage/methylation domain-containing protein [Thermotogaceae bacterium]